MAGKRLKRYGLEGGAKALIAIGLLLNLSAWFAAAYYFGLPGSKVTLFIVPLVFTCVSAIFLLVIRYRYTLFEKYPYLMSLPSLFYRLGEQKDTNKQSVAFSMIFTVHALVLAVVGFMSLLLTITVGASIKSSAASPLLYIYLAVAAVLVISVFLLYRRIYFKLMK